MPMFRRKQIEIEAISFDDLVEYGKANGGNIVNGMPWSFQYKGYPVTHESDDCYLICLRGNPHSLRFNRGDMLATLPNGEIAVCIGKSFAENYDLIEGS